jgi:putative tricarboxylic transport membrane protein
MHGASIRPDQIQPDGPACLFHNLKEEQDASHRSSRKPHESRSFLMFEGLLEGLQILISWPGPLLVLIGVIIGAIGGILPGLGGASTTALLIPVTYGMEPAHAIIFLISVNVSSGLGGQLTSILVNVPGDAPNAATMLDGYPMTRQGRAAEAIGAATWGSIFGAVIGTILLIICIPITRQIILSFSYPEFLMVTLTGLIMIAVLTTGKAWKGLVSAGIGLMLAFIGLDPATGNPRFTFGQLYLWDGIELVPVLIGLFAGAEMISLFARKAGKTTILDTKGEGQHSTLTDGFKATIREWKNVVMSSFIGFWVGIVPGIGGTVASFMAYGRAARMSKHPERFGKGEVGGVIAAETANDADKSGSLLPTIAFGIPGGVGMAVVLTVLILHGYQTGPKLLSGDSTILYVLVVAIFIPRLVAAAGVLLLGRHAIAITKIPGQVLAPIVAVVALVSVYSLRNEILDVVMTVIFGYVGYGMVRFGYSRVALVIALVLGPLVEASYHQTVGTMGLVGVVTRPIAFGLLVVAIATLVLPPVLRLRRKRKNEALAAALTTGDDK